MCFKNVDVGVKLCPGGRSCSWSSTTSSSRRQCDGGGRSGLFSLCNSSYSLWCPLWPPKVVPKEADIRALLVLLAQAHPILRLAGLIFTGEERGALQQKLCWSRTWWIKEGPSTFIIWVCSMSCQWLAEVGTIAKTFVHRYTSLKFVQQRRPNLNYQKIEGPTILRTIFI